MKCQKLLKTPMKEIQKKQAVVILAVWMCQNLKEGSSCQTHCLQLNTIFLQFK